MCPTSIHLWFPPKIWKIVPWLSLTFSLAWIQNSLTISSIFWEVLPGVWNDNHNIFQMKIIFNFFFLHDNQHLENKFSGCPIVFGEIKQLHVFSWPLYFSRFSLTFQVSGNPVLQPTSCPAAQPSTHKVPGIIKLHFFYKNIILCFSLQCEMCEDQYDGWCFNPTTVRLPWLMG